MRTRIPSLVSILCVAAVPAAHAQAWGDTAHFGRGIARLGREGTALNLDLRAPAYGVLVRIVAGQRVQVLDIRDYPAGPSTVRVPLVLLALPSVHSYASGAVTSTGADAGDAGARSMRAEAGCIAAREPPRGSTPKPGDPVPMNVSAPCATYDGPNYPVVSRTTSVRSAPEHQRDHILLLLSDRPVDTLIVAQALRDSTIFASAESAATALPTMLLGTHSQIWAAYLVRR